MRNKIALTGLKKSPAFSLYHFFWGAIDWLYPPYCVSCGKSGYRICPDCLQQIKRLNNSFCPICGRPYNININTLCTFCSESPPHFQALRSWGFYEGPLRDAIHALKYKRDIGLGEVLAQHLIELIKKENWKIDVIAPVPLGKERMEERGYNQSHYLALPIALSCNLSYKPNIVKRIRNTPSQVGLNTQERQQNVQGAFWGNVGELKGKSVLLVDDVTTTGATIQACAEACLKAQAANVYCLTAARTPLARSIDQKSNLNLTG